MPPAPDRLSVSDRLLAMAEAYAKQDRRARAEAARWAAVTPSPPLAWRSRAVQALEDKPDVGPERPIGVR